LSKNKLKEKEKGRKPKTTLKNDLYKKAVDEKFLLYEEKYSLTKPWTKSN